MPDPNPPITPVPQAPVEPRKPKRERDKASNPTATPEPLRGLSLDQLDDLCRAPVKVSIPLLSDGRSIEIECRRLTPAENACVNLEMKRALPKIIPGAKAGEERFDLTDPEYIAKREAGMRRARALAIYLAVPVFKTARPDLQGLDEITEFVQGRLTEEVLTLLFAAIVPMGAGSELQEYVNFF